jgi:hypothetical protein
MRNTKYLACILLMACGNSYRGATQIPRDTLDPVFVSNKDNGINSYQLTDQWVKALRSVQITPKKCIGLIAKDDDTRSHPVEQNTPDLTLIQGNDINGKPGFWNKDYFVGSLRTYCKSGENQCPKAGEQGNEFRVTLWAEPNYQGNRLEIIFCHVF